VSSIRPASVAAAATDRLDLFLTSGFRFHGIRPGRARTSPHKGGTTPYPSLRRTRSAEQISVARIPEAQRLRRCGGFD
jgi:hypothetical protein